MVDSSLQFKNNKKLFTLNKIALSVALGVVITASAGVGIKIKGKGAQLKCNGGMSHLSHVFSESASVFPGDPNTAINTVFTVADDGFLVEQVTAGTHTSTHFDAPAHFIEGGRSVDQLDPDEFVWPAYVIDVRERINLQGGDFQLTVNDILNYENEHGKIKSGSLVIIQTGWDAKFGIDGVDNDGNIVDDYVDDIAPGFSGTAVQWMFDERDIDALGSDTLGPDAYTDALFDATYTTLANDGIALPGLNNLDSLAVKGDLIIAPPVRLINGSGYQVNAIGCLGEEERR